jgi:hypothetical protein
VLELGSSRGSLAIVFARGAPCRVRAKRGCAGAAGSWFFIGARAPRAAAELPRRFVVEFHEARVERGLSGRAVAPASRPPTLSRGGEERGGYAPSSFPDGPACRTHGGAHDLLRVKQEQPVRWLSDRAVGRRGEWPRCAVPLSTRVAPVAAKRPPTRSCEGLRRDRRVADVLRPDARGGFAGATREAVGECRRLGPSRCHWNEGRRRSSTAMHVMTAIVHRHADCRRPRRNVTHGRFAAVTWTEAAADELHRIEDRSAGDMCIDIIASPQPCEALVVHRCRMQL